MNTSRRLRHAAALFGAATLATVLLTPDSARAQTATAVTDPVGYLSISLPANSDTFVSIPFTRPAEFTGAVASVSGSTLTLGGTPGFTTGAFAPLATTAPNDGHKTYYVIIGPKNAALTPTLSVTNGSATVNASTTPEAVAGDTVTVAGYTFTVVSVSGLTLTIDRVYPGTTASGLAATYDHSPSEGRFYTVTANDVGSLTVNLNGDSLSNVAVGTQVSVIPYWTLGTAFPATDEVSNGGKAFVKSTNAKSRGTQLLIPNSTGKGINLSTSVIYLFYSGAWYTDSDFNTMRNDDAIAPDSYFIVRNPLSGKQSDGSPLVFTPTGGVVVTRLTTPLTTQPDVRQDNPVTVTRPTAITLNDSGLVVRASDGTAVGGSFKVSPSFKNPGDQLLVFDNTLVGINKAAKAIYLYYNNGWRNNGPGADPAQDAGSDFLLPGSGIIIRKATVPNGVTSFWQNSRNYLN